MKELREKARYIPNFADGDEVMGMYIPFPHLNITQDGNITKWIFTAEDLGEGNGRMGYPDLLILASNYSKCDDTGCDAVHRLHGSQSVSTIYPNVYEYNVDPPLPVKTGYFIAIHQPPEQDARMSLSFVKRARQGEIDLGKNQTPLPSPGEQYHPLLHLEITSMVTEQEILLLILFLCVFAADMQFTAESPSESPSEPPSESTIESPSECTSESPSESTTESSPVAGAVVGGIVGVLIILTAAILIAVVVILLVRRRQGRTQLMKGTTNPIYGKKGK